MIISERHPHDTNGLVDTICLEEGLLSAPFQKGLRAGFLHAQGKPNCFYGYKHGTVHNELWKVGFAKGTQAWRSLQAYIKGFNSTDFERSTFYGGDVYSFGSPEWCSFVNGMNANKKAVKETT